MTPLVTSHCRDNRLTTVSTSPYFVTVRHIHTETKDKYRTPKNLLTQQSKSSHPQGPRSIFRSINLSCIVNDPQLPSFTSFWLCLVPLFTLELSPSPRVHFFLNSGGSSLFSSRVQPPPPQVSTRFSILKHIGFWFQFPLLTSRSIRSSREQTKILHIFPCATVWLGSPSRRFCILGN